MVMLDVLNAFLTTNQEPIAAPLPIFILTPRPGRFDALSRTSAPAARK